MVSVARALLRRKYKGETSRDPETISAGTATAVLDTTATSGTVQENTAEVTATEDLMPHHYFSAQEHKRKTGRCPKGFTADASGRCQRAKNKRRHFGRVPGRGKGRRALVEAGGLIARIRNRSCSCRQAEAVPLNEATIQKWRKDLLLLLKNVDRLVEFHKKVPDWYHSPEEEKEFRDLQAKQKHMLDAFWEGVKRLRIEFDRFFFERLLDSGLKGRHLDLGGGDFTNQYIREKHEENRKYWDARLRKSLWSVSHGLIDQPRSPWQRNVSGKTGLQLWADRLRHAMRDAWKELDAFATWYHEFHAARGNESQHATVPVLKAEIIEIEGFKAKIVGFNPEEENDARHMEVLKEGLRIYRQKAKTNYPPLLHRQLPLVLSMSGSDGSAAASYHGRYIKVNMIWSGSPLDMAKTLAHEMGHHLFTLLSTEARRYWTAAVHEDWGPLDLVKVVADWPQGKKFTSEYAETLRETDPDLSLQLMMLSMPYGYGSPQASTKEDVEKLIADGTKVVLPRNPITHYANKNPDESFCEALSMLVVYGPRSVHQLVRQWLHTVLPDLRTGQTVLARLLAQE